MDEQHQVEPLQHTVDRIIDHLHALSREVLGLDADRTGRIERELLYAAQDRDRPRPDQEKVFRVDDE